MLNNLSKKINNELQEEQDRQDFYMLIHEDTEYENFIDNRLLNLSENGVNDQMLKNEMPFLFIEDTVVDDDLITTLEKEVDYEDNFDKKPISDNDETTDLQEPKDFSDDFSAKYASDADADTKLTKEEDYADNQKTPVNIDEFSNEAAVDFLFEMGDILGALELMEAEECDGTNLEVDCPDEGDVIPQADEADVDDTESPEGGLVEPVSESDEFEEDEDSLDEDFSSLEEEFNALFESSEEDDEDDEDDSEEEDEDEEDDSDEDDSDDEDSDDDEECEDDEDDEKKSESVSILDWFA